MSEHHGKPPTSVGEFIVALLGSLIAPALVIFLLVKLVLGIQATHKDDADPAVANTAIAKRIQPVGEVSLKDSSVPQAAKSGEQVVNEICIACHGTGALGSPQIGDAGAWGPRIATGYEALLNSALHGKGAMGAQGGGEFEDIEIGRAVVYMANNGGASFPIPEPAVAASAAASAAQ